MNEIGTAAASAPRTIKIIDILSIAPGVEPEKDSTTAFYECKALVCDPQVDTHIAVLDEDLVQQETVWISEWSSNAIKPGIYRIMFGKTWHGCPVYEVA